MLYSIVLKLLYTYISQRNVGGGYFTAPRENRLSKGQIGRKLIFCQKGFLWPPQCRKVNLECLTEEYKFAAGKVGYPVAMGIINCNGAYKTVAGTSHQHAINDGNIAKNRTKNKYYMENRTLLWTNPEPVDYWTVCVCVPKQSLRMNGITEYKNVEKRTSIKELYNGLFGSSQDTYMDTQRNSCDKCDSMDNLVKLNSLNEILM